MVTAAQLDIVIRAQDQASRTIRGIERNLGGLNTVTRSFGLGSVASYTAATAALGGFVAMGVGELMEAQRVQAQTNAVLKSTGEIAGVTARHVEELSSRLSMLAAVDDEVIASGANVLLTFTSIRNSGVDQTFDRAMQAALDLSRAFGQDLQGSIVQVGKALQDPIRGVTALRRVGIQLSAEQEKQIRQFVEMNDLVGAQKVILGELERQVGGSAEAYGTTFVGAVAKAKIRLEEFAAEVIGRIILGLDYYLDGLQRFFGFVGEQFENLRDKAIEFARMVEAADWAGILPFDELAKMATSTEEVGEHAVSLRADFLALGTAANQAVGAIGAMGPELTAVGQIQSTMAVRDRLIELEEGARAAGEAADEARRKFFDLLHVPSQERLTREALLGQAQFNVARLEDQGAKDGLLSPERQSWYQWLVSTFIPAQENWLRTDELNVDRIEKGALAAQSITGDYRDWYQVLNGQLVPGMRNLNDGTWNSTDAVGNLAKEFPFNGEINVASNVDIPKASKIKPELRTFINTVNEFLKDLPFNWGFDGPAIPPPKDTKAELRTFVNGVNRFLKSIPFFGWGFDPPGIPPPKDTKRELQAYVTDVNAFLKSIPFFGWGFDNPYVPPKEDTKAVLDAYVIDVNKFLKSIPFFRWGLSVPSTPPDADISAQVSYIISRVRYWWGVFTGTGGATPGVTPGAFMPTETQAAYALRSQITSLPRPDNRLTATGSGGVGTLIVNFNGTDLATPSGRTYVVNNIYQALTDRMRRG